MLFENARVSTAFGPCETIKHCCKVQAEGAREQAVREFAGIPNAEKPAKSEAAEEQTDGLPGSMGHDTDVRQGSAAVEQELRPLQPTRPSGIHEGVHNELLSSQV